MKNKCALGYLEYKTPVLLPQTVYIRIVNALLRAFFNLIVLCVRPNWGLIEASKPHLKILTQLTHVAMSH